MATIQWVKDRAASLTMLFYSELIVSEIGESPRDIVVRSLKASMARLQTVRHWLEVTRFTGGK
jgi:hypothetical protein